MNQNTITFPSERFSRLLRMAVNLTAQMLFACCLSFSGTLLAQQETEPDFSFVEQDPVPPDNDLHTYFARNIRYPRKAIEEGVGGRVFVTFLISSSGEVTDVKLLKGAGYGMDEEALRACKEMPKWTPGKNGGRAVKVRMNIPIVFKWEDVPFTKEDSLKMMKRYGKAYMKECEDSPDFGPKKENEGSYQFESRARRYRQFQSERFRHYQDLYLQDNKAELVKRRLLAFEIGRSYRSENTSFDKIGSYHKKSQSGRVKICGSAEGEFLRMALEAAPRGCSLGRRDNRCAKGRKNDQEKGQRPGSHVLLPLQ